MKDVCNRHGTIAEAVPEQVELDKKLSGMAEPYTLSRMNEMGGIAYNKLSEKVNSPSEFHHDL